MPSTLLVDRLILLAILGFRWLARSWCTYVGKNCSNDVPLHKQRVDISKLVPLPGKPGVDPSPSGLLASMLEQLPQIDHIRNRTENETTALDCINDASKGEVSIRPLAVWIGMTTQALRWQIGATRHYYPRPTSFLLPFPDTPDERFPDYFNPVYVHVIVVY